MLYLGDEFILFRGVLGDLGSHAHAAPAFIGSLNQTVSIECRGVTKPFQLAYIPAGLVHKPDFGGAISSVMYLRLDSRWALRTKRYFQNDGITEVGSRPFRDAFFADCTDNPASLTDELLSALEQFLPPAMINAPQQDQRVRMMLAKSQLGRGSEARDFDGREQAGMIFKPRSGMGDRTNGRGFSASRLRHVFVAETSVPYRRHVLWTRLEDALVRALSGRNLTQAAHEAGFSDSSHFAHAFRDMFGLPPSVVIASITSFEDGRKLEYRNEQ